MDANDEMCKSLVKWLQTIVTNKTRNINELCDGVAMVDALIQIAPQHFTKLEPKIKRDAGSSWRLRVSNLKKIVEAVIEYYQDVLTLQLLEGGRPDVNEIGAKNDSIQLAKLLRLILGCAINCDRKQEYITKIMEMEESCQQNIMQAIQQLEEVTGGRSGLSLLMLDTDTRVVRLVSELEAANDAKETLAVQCQQLESQIHTLTEEKQTLLSESQSLREKETRTSDIRKQLELLKEELFKAEVTRDDFKAKLNEQHKQLQSYQEKIVELQLAANDTSRLKDEVDALSESAVKVQNLEMTLASYKKKLENYTDMKKGMQKLEEKNVEYLQKNLEYEEELTKTNGWKNQCETYKKQLVEIQQKLDEETQRADKGQFNCEKLESKLIALQGERERLAQERDALKEENEELKLGQPKSETAAAMSQELTPTEMKERLRYLEKENRSLRTTSQEHEATQAMLDSALGRTNTLQQQNRNLNQTVLKLEAQIEELSKSQQIISNESSENNYKEKIVALQEALNAKENELHITQAKYTRNLDKAREVAQQLEVKSNGETTSSLHHHHHQPTTSSSHNNMSEIEERLIVSTFYKLGVARHREATEERLAVLNGGQGQSFLTRLRQSTPRKQIRYKTYKSK